VAALDSSTVAVSGGEVDWLAAYDSANVTMTAGDAGRLRARDSSTLEFSGGRVLYFDFHAYDSSTVSMTGGQVLHGLYASQSSSVTMSGGTVEAVLAAEDFSTIAILGSDFAVDGSPVPYGDLAPLTGTLTGTLASGDPIDNTFYQGGGSYTGTIALVRQSAIRVPALSLPSQLALAAALLAFGLAVGRGRQVV
jgi:hypothetical protein